MAEAQSGEHSHDSAHVEEAKYFKVGDLFKTYHEFQEKLEKYKKTYYVEFWKKEARKITAARSKM